MFESFNPWLISITLDVQNCTFPNYRFCKILDSFLAFAGDLQLKGLRGDARAEMVEKIQENT